VELTTSPNRESESTLTSRKLHGKVLVILRQVGVDLLVLLVEPLIGMGWGALLLSLAPSLRLVGGSLTLGVLGPRIGRSGMDTLNSEA